MPFKNTYQRALAVSGTATSFATAIPTNIEPFMDGVINVPEGMDTLEVLFFGAGSNNNTFDCQIIGLCAAVVRNLPPPRAFIEGGLGGTLFIQEVLAEITATLSSTVIGVGGCVAIATDLFADTVVLNKGVVGIANTVTVDACPAKLTLDISGCEKIRLSFSTTSSATNCNALVRFSKGT